MIFVLLKTWHLPHIYIMVVSFGTSFPLGSMKIPCFIAVGAQKCMLNTLKKRYVFWMVLRFATAPAILFHHFNLRTVFAVISHTSAFRCMYRHCQALTYVMIIGLWLATWQHLFTGLPATIYCTSMGKHLWAASLDTAHSLCKLAFGVVHKLIRVQRSMKCVHRSTEVCNVTWSVFTRVQQKFAT